MVLRNNGRDIKLNTSLQTIVKFGFLDRTEGAHQDHRRQTKLIHADKPLFLYLSR